MNKCKNRNVWIIWSSLVMLMMVYLGYLLLEGEDRTVFMPGEMTGGHHQIGIACDACHGEAFSDMDAMQDNCVSCHGDLRKKPFDSHPRSKFTDPRNADRLENINPLYCVTCHIEHRPELADKAGVTQPGGFCVHCHADVGENRPSHQGMEFNTCASAGCHNYHNNRSIYTDFLVKNMDEPDLLEKRRVPEKEYAQVLDEIMSYPHDQYPVKTIGLKDIDAPLKVQFKTTDTIRHDWMSTAHAKSGVNCSACHMPEIEGQQAVWADKPDHKVCAQCHDIEVKHFTQGKHGMRLAQNLSPMTAEMARLPMRDNALNKQLGCNSCHQAHQYKLDSAAVGACLGCHDDEHSRAYKDSPHYELWLKEQSGELPKGSGVSCATCHMPRVAVDVNDWLRRTVVQHNQNANLVPNEKMIRSACLNCHGLPFAIDSLADQALIKNNFKGNPQVHIKSVDLAREDYIRHLNKTGGAED